MKMMYKGKKIIKATGDSGIKKIRNIKTPNQIATSLIPRLIYIPETMDWWIEFTDVPQNVLDYIRDGYRIHISPKIRKGLRITGNNGVTFPHSLGESTGMFVRRDITGLLWSDARRKRIKYTREMERILTNMNNMYRYSFPEFRSSKNSEADGYKDPYIYHYFDFIITVVDPGNVFGRRYDIGAKLNDNREVVYVAVEDYLFGNDNRSRDINENPLRYKVMLHQNANIDFDHEYQKHYRLKFGKIFGSVDHGQDRIEIRIANRDYPYFETYDSQFLMSEDSDD